MVDQRQSDPLNIQPQEVQEPLRPRVCLAHAGVQHSYKVAMVLAEEDMLRRFYTTLYIDNEGIISYLAKKLIPKHSKFARIVSRRYTPGLPGQIITSIPWFELGEKLFNTFTCNSFNNELLTWRNAQFDRSVAQKLDGEKDLFDIFYGFSGSCLLTLQRAKEMGKIVLLDHHDIHHSAARKLIEEELENNPDFASTIPFWPPYKPYLDRVDREIHEADHHIVLSSFARTTYLNAGIDPKQISVVPLGVDTSRFSTRTPLGMTGRNVFRVIFVGSVTQRKGIKYLLEAMKQLRFPRSELVIAGRSYGSDKPLERYREIVSDMRYVEAKELPDLLRTCDVLVLPSIYDSFGQVIIEGMACGLPVIVSENTAGADVVREGTDGFVVPIRDVEAIKQRLETLYRDVGLRVWMGRNAMSRAREFTLHTYKARLTKVISDVASD